MDPAGLQAPVGAPPPQNPAGAPVPAPAPTASAAVEPLRGAGVHRVKIDLCVKGFMDIPSDHSVRSPVIHSETMGLKGASSSWRFAAMVSQQYRPMFLLFFASETDIQMALQWSVSIVKPGSNNPLCTSKLCNSLLKRKKGVFMQKCNKCKSRFNGIPWCCKVLRDRDFGLRSKIQQNKWHVDGDLHLVADVRFKVLTGGQANGDLQRPESSLMLGLQQQLENPGSLYADFELISSDGVHIKANKLILSLISPVFRAMFDTDCQEVREGSCNIPDADAESIRALMAFSCGKSPDKWKFDFTAKLLRLADKYEVLQLKEKCAAKLAGMINCRNAVDILGLADSHCCKLLKNEVFIFLEDNLENATMEGTLVKMLDRGVKRPLLEEWQAHLNKRRRGVQWKPVDEGSSGRNAPAEVGDLEPESS